MPKIGRHFVFFVQILAIFTILILKIKGFSRSLSCKAMQINVLYDVFVYRIISMCDHETV